jgi:hypothetical protein
MGVIFFIGYHWLLGATAKEKCEHRNEKYGKNLHTRFLSMHRIGSTSKWQVVNGEIPELSASIRNSDVGFTKMPRHQRSGLLALCGGAFLGLVLCQFGEWLKDAFGGE